MDWLSAAQQLRHDGQPGVLVTVIEVRGHAPREAGAKMVVSRDRTWGSVGGGNLEATAVARARELIESGAVEPEIRESQLNPHARTEHGRQCCGGVVRLLLEPLAVPPVVALFGIGHVGYELARILSRLPVRLMLVDSRSGQLDRVRLADIIDGHADVGIYHTLLGEQVLEQLPRGAHVVIMTHDHAEDFALCDAALRLPQPLGSIGLIGSSVKWTRFQAMLSEQGHSAETIGRITCPIGHPGITGKDPAVIAVAVASALLQKLPGNEEAAVNGEKEEKAEWALTTASQRAAAPTGQYLSPQAHPRRDEGATREGGAFRRTGGERESRAT
jgi:xanthine dehydrogenase accessory factor